MGVHSFGQVASCVSTYLKLELLSHPSHERPRRRRRFHLFEAGAFVTRRAATQSFTVASVSTYLKLELLSRFRARLPGHGVTVRFHLFEAGAFVTSVFQQYLSGGLRVSTYLKLELLSPAILHPSPRGPRAFPPI